MSSADGQRLAAVFTLAEGRGSAELDLDEVLVDALDHVRSLLQADTAAVLLRDGDAPYLTARAARGLEDEVRQGVRVPLGVGFAGTIAARREPILLNRIDRTTVANPILWEKGIKAMLGVPLSSGGHVIGVLHVGRLSERPFMVADVDTLRHAGEQVIATIQARDAAINALAGRHLERSLQPTTLPVVSGVDFAARYVPAERRAVGGDWYDAFVLPNGDLWIVTGDVAGHGLNAAVVMGRVKSAMRAYALLGVSPEEVLELTDRKVAQFEIGTMITAVCALAQPPYEKIRIALAGHPPPVLASPGSTGRLVDADTGPPLGVEPTTRRGAIDLIWPAEAVLLFYTDGLVERRDVDLGQRLDRLANAVNADVPEQVCIAVMHDMIGSDPVVDDVAVLAVRRSPAATGNVAGQRG